MASNCENPSGVDAKDFGKVPAIEKRDVRPVATQVVEKTAKEYNMNHPRRGKCIIFYYTDFDQSLNLLERDCSHHDAKNAKETFEKLDFDVESHHNLKYSQLRNILQNVREADHSTHDCLTVVFLSHGVYNKFAGVQRLYAYDESFEAEELFDYFSGINCLSLVGKPKLFFIQAFRGDLPMKLGRIKVQSIFERPAVQGLAAYSISSYADILKMWASFPGYDEFKIKGIQGSAFIHILNKVLHEEGTEEDLNSLLLRVTREVTAQYKSSVLDKNMDDDEPIPYMESTLTRDVYFRPKNSKVFSNTVLAKPTLTYSV